MARRETDNIGHNAHSGDLSWFGIPNYFKTRGLFMVFPFSQIYFNWGWSMVFKRHGPMTFLARDGYVEA